jgi:hypothetical protein
MWATLSLVKFGIKSMADINREPQTLSVNIFEAMVQDTAQGNNDNADAGFELASEPYDRSPIAGLDSSVIKEWHHAASSKDANLGVLDARPPLPRVWSNLYSSWNLAFVSTYSNNPMFLSKLLAPVVHLYQKDGNQGLYIWPRLVCLYIHVQYEIMSRTSGGTGRQPILLKVVKSGKPEHDRFYGDWRSDLTTALFGTVNKLAARHFQTRLEAIIEAKNSFLLRNTYRMSRFSIIASWRKVKVRLHGSEDTSERAGFYLVHKVQTRAYQSSFLVAH